MCPLRRQRGLPRVRPRKRLPRASSSRSQGRHPLSLIRGLLCAFLLSEHLHVLSLPPTHTPAS